MKGVVPSGESAWDWGKGTGQRKIVLRKFSVSPCFTSVSCLKQCLNVLFFKSVSIYPYSDKNMQLV